MAQDKKVQQLDADGFDTFLTKFQALLAPFVDLATEYKDDKGKFPGCAAVSTLAGLSCQLKSIQGAPMEKRQKIIAQWLRQLSAAMQPFSVAMHRDVMVSMDASAPAPPPSADEA